MNKTLQRICIGTLGVAMLLAATLTQAAPNIMVIEPTAAGQATGSGWFPLENAFDKQPAWDADLGEPVGGSTTNHVPGYANSWGYIDFGPNWSKVRITQTWTQYRKWLSTAQTPFVDFWWDDDKDKTNDDGIVEPTIKFNSAAQTCPK